MLGRMAPPVKPGWCVTAFGSRPGAKALSKAL